MSCIVPRIVEQKKVIHLDVLGILDETGRWNYKAARKRTAPASDGIPRLCGSPRPFGGLGGQSPNPSIADLMPLQLLAFLELKGVA